MTTNQKKLEEFWDKVQEVSPSDIESESVYLVSNENISDLLNSLFQEIEEKIKEKRKETWKFYHEAQLWEEQKQAVRPYDDMLEALKTIKERYL